MPFFCFEKNNESKIYNNDTAIYSNLLVGSNSIKNGDIYKMHTYKDSILKTEGSYVLYPGNVHKLFKEDNDLIIPSVGAFPLAPGNGGDEEYNLSIFIKNVIRSLIVN